MTASIDNVANDGQTGEADDVRGSISNLIGSTYYMGDTLIGSSGPNVLAGLYGSDQLTGGDGADYLDGGASNDTLNGDAGNDTLNSRGDYSTDADNCGTGTDGVVADSFDTVNADCESVSNPAAAPARAATQERTYEAARSRLDIVRQAALAHGRSAR